MLLTGIVYLITDTYYFIIPCKGVTSGRGSVGGVALPTFLKFVGILTKCVGKICRPNLSVNVEYFIIKKRNAEFLSKSSPAEIKLLPAMTAFKEVI